MPLGGNFRRSLDEAPVPVLQRLLELPHLLAVEVVLAEERMVMLLDEDVDQLIDFDLHFFVTTDQPWGIGNAMGRVELNNLKSLYNPGDPRRGNDGIWIG
jgi:hypothetical protein